MSCIYCYCTDGKEINEDQLSSTTSSLTKAQAVAVKKRVDTLNATIRKKQKQQPKKDVREIFAPTDVPVSYGGLVSCQDINVKYKMFLIVSNDCEIETISFRFVQVRHKETNVHNF